jgi:hypothetical protein
MPAWKAELFRRLILVCAAAALTMAPRAVAAQYFGANKVQYKPLQFHVLETEHFDIYFHQDDREMVDTAGRLAERWWRRLSDFFGREPAGRQPIVLYGSHLTFEQTLVVPDAIDVATGGLTEPSRRRVAMPFASSLGETDHVVGHELVHVFQFDVFTTPQRSREGGSDPVPLWFTEGLAEFLSLGRLNPHTAMWLRDAVLHNTLPSMTDLDRSAYFPYRWGHAWWAYVDGRWGARAAADVFVTGAAVGIRSALERVLGVTPDEFTAGWHAALREAYGAPADTAPVGRVVVAARPLGGATNVGPALSPDGHWLAFLSERSLLSIDLFVADAATGAIASRLTDTSVDSRYSNLQYIDSAGAWNAAGTRLAVGTVTSGRAAITVFTWPGGSRERDIVIDEVDEIYSPTWSPDGSSIAFSAMAGGATDLFVYDLVPGRVRRLTRDAFADLQPSWQPGGRSIAFATDRFTSDVEALEFGPYRLALIDADSSAIQPVAAFTTGKHVSPRWSGDGRRLYFVSDQDGRSDVYSVAVASGELRRLTRSATGVSGITAVSPSISVAAGTGALVASVFERSSTAIYRLDASAEGEPVDAAAPAIALRLPPVDAPAGPTALWRDDPVPPATQMPVMKYRPRLSLDRVTQAAFGVGVGRFGATVGTGLGLAFSDMLNTHWLVGGVQIDESTSIRNAAAYAAYLNQVHRWNWTIIGSSIPTYVGVRSSSLGALFDMLFEPIEVIRQTERVATAMASYPFDRSRRVELQGGVTRLTFERFLGTVDGGEWTTAAPALTLGTAGMALVGDTTTRGAISVLRGQRYRLEAAPAFGTIHYVNALADYRKYVMPVPFYTVAVRALHFGRYGSGAEDIRIPPLYLGYPTLVRGYDRGSSIAERCMVPLVADCTSVDHMVGSRVAVGNVELRFPLLRPFGVSRGMYGPEAVEVAFFMDSGVAWRGAAVGPVNGGAWSAGVTFRTNLVGLGLGQFDIVRPFSQPGSGWSLQFSLAPPL